MQENRTFDKNLSRMFIEAILALVAALVGFVYYKLSSSARYFEERNLKHVTGSTAIKNFLKTAFRQVDVFEIAQDSYNAFPNEP